jgi:hypothetical protein
MAGCAIQNMSPPNTPSSLDVVGMSPYDAKQLLEQESINAQISFVTILGTEVTIESAAHYSGWEVIAFESNAESNNEILVTIQMTDSELEKRNTLISDYIQSESAFGWAGSITYSDSDELLVLKYQGSTPSYDSFRPFTGLPEPNSAAYRLMENLNGSALVTYYTSDGYLVAILYASNKNASPDQFERANIKTKELTEEADAYATVHLDEFINNFIGLKFSNDRLLYKTYESAEYNHTDSGITITVVMAPGIDFTVPGAPQSLEELTAIWREVAEPLTRFTRTGISFVFYTSSGKPQFATASPDIQDYIISAAPKDDVLLPR